MYNSDQSIEITYLHAPLIHMKIIFSIAFILISSLQISGQDTYESSCDNGIDDDLDGFIDYYDDDCECQDVLFNAQCDIECHIIPDSVPAISVNLKWMSALINDSRAAKPRNIIVDDNSNIYVNTKFEFGDSLVYRVSNINGFSGALNGHILFDSSKQSITYQIAIARNKFNNNIELFSKSSTGIVHCKNIAGNTIWTNDQFQADFRSFSNPRLADINQDGIPELYAGNIILNSLTGNTLFVGDKGKGCNFTNVFDTCSVGAESIVADLTLHPGLEMVAGNVVYEIDLLNLNDSIGNVNSVITAPSPVKEGVSSVGDFDGDGFFEIVTVRSNELGDGGIWIWNPRNQQLLALGSGVELGIGGGTPTIADLDNDCVPEIIVAYRREVKIYKYDGSTDLIYLERIETTDDSAFTSATVFDLYNDGFPEIIYRDMSTFRIFDGVSFETLYSTPLFAGTAGESPIVTDLDNDGHAEIIIHGGLENQDSLRVFCFESATTPWAPARKVWNQTGYHVTNVNDDLTIPQYQQNSAAFFDTDSCFQETCPQVYNTFGVQATYRTQKGCVVFPEQPDLTIEILDYLCEGDSIVYCLSIENLSDEPVGPDCITAALYLGSFTIPDLVDTFRWCVIRDNTTGRLDFSDTLKVTLPLEKNSFDAFWTINDLGTLPGIWNAAETGIAECNYENNVDAVTSFVSLPCRNWFVIDLDSSCQYVVTLDSILSERTACESFYEYDIFYQADTGNVLLDTNVLVIPGFYTLRVTIVGSGNQCWTSVEIRDSFPILDLGPDIVRCDNQPIEITAQSGFASYLWTDNTIEPTYQALTDGIHFVEVSDSCGRIQRDTILVTTEISMQAQIISDNEIVCPEDEVLLSTTLMFDTLNWYIDDQVICEGCDSMVVTPTEDVTIHVIADNMGCISIDSILLTVLPTYLDTIYDSICEGDSVVIDGESYLESGFYNFDFETVAGCDSNLVLLLTENPVDTFIQNIQLCEGDSVLVFGQYYYDTSFLLSSDQNRFGCDSLTDISIVLVEELSDTTFISICESDSTLIFGAWEKVEGTFSMGFPTSGGCDSTHVTILAVESVSTSTQSATICVGDSFFFNNVYYSEADLYQAFLTSQNGCDSIVFLDLSVDSLIEMNVPLILCQLDTFITATDTLTSDGVALEVYQSAFGCDSVVTYDVTFIARPTQNEQYAMCEGDSIFLGGQYYYEAVNFADTIADILCDSIISYDLSVFPSTISDQNYSLINGQSIVINGEEFTAAGNYERIIENNEGCDSIIFISITEEEAEEPVYPNIFSPNGDGFNDEWIFDLTDYPMNEVTIYDRWGNKIAHWQNESVITWSGQYKGRALVVGVYVLMFVYEERGVMKMHSGNITLFR